MTKKETQIVKLLEPLADQANFLIIHTTTDLKEATSILSRLNKLNDDIELESNKVLIPLKEAEKAEKARWKLPKQYYTEAIASIRLKMAEYQTNLVNQQKAEEQAIVGRIAPGKGHISLETAIKKMEALSKIDKTTSTEEGSVTFVETKKLKVLDISVIPELYWHINEELLLEDLKAGVIIPGVEIEIIQSPRNIR